MGSIVAWHKNFYGTPPALPAGWLECNGQTVSDVDSPFNGSAVPNLNGNRYFLRGNGTSGPTEQDQFQGHRHSHSESANFVVADTGGTYSGGAFPAFVRPLSILDPTSDGSNGTPRTGSETRPVNMSVVWIIRIK